VHVVKPVIHWMHQYVVNRNVFIDCLKVLPPIAGSRKLSGREFQTNRPATRSPIGHRSWAGGLVHLGAVGWQIGDVAVMRHLWLVGTILRNTEVLDHAGSWTPWCRACTQLVQKHPANVGKEESQQASVELVSTADHTSCSVQHSLQFRCHCFRGSLQDGIAIMNVWRDKRMYKCSHQFCVLHVCSLFNVLAC